MTIVLCLYCIIFQHTELKLINFIEFLDVMNIKTKLMIVISQEIAGFFQNMLPWYNTENKMLIDGSFSCVNKWWISEQKINIITLDVKISGSS